jgi:hypothetical protein
LKSASIERRRFRNYAGRASGSFFHGDLSNGAMARISRF